MLNQFVRENSIKSVLELGCGDGNQAMQFNFPAYIGLDISATAIQKCKTLFGNGLDKQFYILDETTDILEAELTISLDVIYHLVEDAVYENYMRHLFSAAGRFVIIYAWDVEEKKNYHVRHRNFSKWIKDHQPDFQLKEQIRQSPYADFFIYQRISQVDG